MKKLIIGATSVAFGFPDEASVVSERSNCNAKTISLKEHLNAGSNRFNCSKDEKISILLKKLFCTLFSNKIGLKKNY